MAYYVTCLRLAEIRLSEDKAEELEEWAPYHYTIQPPQDIACNPYEHHTIQMECAVTGSDLYSLWL
jgi:hypothetical protein